LFAFCFHCRSFYRETRELEAIQKQPRIFRRFAPQDDSAGGNKEVSGEDLWCVLGEDESVPFQGDGFLINLKECQSCSQPFGLFAFDYCELTRSLGLHEVECTNQIALQIAAMHDGIQET